MEITEQNTQYIITEIEDVLELVDSFVNLKSKDIWQAKLESILMIMTRKDGGVLI